MKCMKLTDSQYARAYKKEIEASFAAEEASRLWKTAENHFRQLVSENVHIPKEVAVHTNKNIFPAIAVYKAVQGKYSEKALEILEKGSAEVSEKSGRMLSKMLKIPGFKSIFMKIFSLGVKTAFGEKAGFSYRFNSDTSRDLEFDMLKCPYADYCKKYGCEEIAHIFCKNDEYAYGSLPGIKFIRTKTIGTGGSCCDFKYKRS